MNQPSPAIVSQAAVRRLPRMALLLLSLAYVLPGFIGRSPWRSSDIEAFGVMQDLAAGRADWWQPSVMGLPASVDALLPYWLGAWALQWAPAWMAPDFAARVPFIALLGLTLISVWQAVYQLALSPRAQPVAFAFGGEARPADYARALADGGLLAVMACLGLAQLSHETTPAVAQLCALSLCFYGVSGLPQRSVSPVLALAAGLPGLTLSGAPAVAALAGAGSLVILALQVNEAQRVLRPSRLMIVATLTLLCAALATRLDLWHWHLQMPAMRWQTWQGLGSLLLWFTWPAWPLALWTLWRWRRQLLERSLSRHLALPLWFVAITVGGAVFTPFGDRALLLALPPLASLAAFALPTLRRSVSALIDWFTLIFFTGCGLIIWVVWVAMQTGFPPQPAANVQRLAPGFESGFIPLPFMFAALASLAWLGLVKWRVGRHRAALWKSLVLPAAGAALCWLLLTTLWMPLLDHARSYAPMTRKLAQSVAPENCLQTFGLRAGLLAGLQFHTRLTLQAMNDQATCRWLLVDREVARSLPSLIDLNSWQLQVEMGHPRPGEEDVLLFRRSSPEQR